MCLSTLTFAIVLGLLSSPQIASTLTISETISKSGEKLVLPCGEFGDQFNRDPGIAAVLWENPLDQAVDFSRHRSRFTFDATTNSLIISDTKSFDSGAYTCILKIRVEESQKKTGSSRDGESQKYSYKPVQKHIVQVNDLPVFVTQLSPDTSVVTGSNAIFPCQAVDENGDPVNVVWSKLGSPLDHEKIKQNKDGSLSVKNATKELAGTYICSAYVTSKGHDVKGSPLISSLDERVISKSESVLHLSIKDSVIFDIEPTNQEVVAGQDAFFHCSADAPVIFWELHHQDGQSELLFPVQENSDQRVGVFPNKTLYIRQVRPDQDNLGVACVAESEKSHAKLIIKDHYGCKVPTFVRTPNAVVAQRGSTILLRCTVNNLDENAEVSWYFRAKHGPSLSFKLLEPSERRMLLPSGDLQILFARDQDDDKDSGEYECTVLCNNTIQDSVTARVEVTDSASGVTEFKGSYAIQFFEQSPPYLVRINSTEAQLSWTNMNPDICGVLEFYCNDGTMSTWNRTLPCHVMTDNTQSVKVSGLKTATTCKVAVRSQSVQTGFTTKLSPIITFTTPTNLTREQFHQREENIPTPPNNELVKVTLKGEVISFSKLLLFWTVDADYVFMGFDVKCHYTVNDTLKELKLSTPDGSWRSSVIENLNASTTYECFVLVNSSPEKTSVTNVVVLETPPKPAPKPPLNLTARRSGDSFILIEWEKPSVGPLDANITGYQVWCFSGENLIQQKVLKLGPDATQVSLPLPTEYAQIRIQVAAMSDEVVGRRSVPFVINLTPSPISDDSFLVSLFKKPWLLVVTGVIVWLLLFLVCVVLIRKYVSEKLSNSGHVSSQCCSIEAFRQGVYAGTYEDPRSHHKWMQQGDVLTLHPQNPLSCTGINNGINDHFMSINGTLASRNLEMMNNLPHQCLADLDSRSVPNLVSDVGSDESYEEIAMNEAMPNQMIPPSYSHPNCPSAVPYYAVYEQQKFHGNHHNAYDIPPHVAYNEQPTAKLNQVAMDPNACSPGYTVHLRPKMGSNALMLRTTSFHSCMGNKLTQNVKPCTSSGSSHPVTILPRNSTTMPLVDDSSCKYSHSNAQGNPSDHHHNSSMPRQGSKKTHGPDIPPVFPHSPAYYHELDPNRQSETFSEGALTGAYEELPNFSSQNLRPESRNSSHSSSGNNCRKHSLRDKTASNGDSAC